MVNDRMINRWLTWFEALIVTDWDDNDWEGDPEMIPFDELSDNPIGRDPDEIENESLSPLTVGQRENGTPFDIEKEDRE